MKLLQLNDGRAINMDNIIEIEPTYSGSTLLKVMLTSERRKLFYYADLAQEVMRWVAQHTEESDHAH